MENWQRKWQLGNKFYGYCRRRSQLFLKPFQRRISRYNGWGIILSNSFPQFVNHEDNRDEPPKSIRVFWIKVLLMWTFTKGLLGTKYLGTINFPNIRLTSYPITFIVGVSFLFLPGLLIHSYMIDLSKMDTSLISSVPQKINSGAELRQASKYLL